MLRYSEKFVYGAMKRSNHRYYLSLISDGVHASPPPSLASMAVVGSWMEEGGAHMVLSTARRPPTLSRPVSMRVWYRAR